MKYYVLKCTVSSADLNEENYGVMLVNDDNSREYACNISKDAEGITDLVNQMNDYMVEPFQAKEIIEDFVYKKDVALHT